MPFYCRSSSLTRTLTSWALLLIALAGAMSADNLVAGVNYEELPIRYSATQEFNPVTELKSRIATKQSRLVFEKPHGYLKSVLNELSIPVSSQVLVFSKTSLQAEKISPATPRAIYFNDSIHVGYVQGGTLELAVADARLGMVFYTLEQFENELPLIERQNDRCLNCHGAARTRNVPGLLVRSVFPDPQGQPVVAAGGFLSNHSSPLEKRWGGR